MPYADVTRVEPSTCECPGGCIRVIKVAFHHAVALHHHLTHCLPVARYITHRLIDDPHKTGGHLILALPGKQATPFISSHIGPPPVAATKLIKTERLGLFIHMDRAQ